MIYYPERRRFAVLKRKLLRARKLFAEQGLRPLVASAVDEMRHEMRYDLLDLVDLVSPDPVMDRDWDNLLVLDACRYDVYAAHALGGGGVERITAPGGHSMEFVQQHFADTPRHETICVTANPWYVHLRDHLDLFKLVAFWNPNRDGELHCSPSGLLDRAIEAHRNWPDKRLVVHLMQPHIPYVTREGDEIVVRTGFGKYPDMISAGRSIDEIRAAYEESLETALPEVERFLDEVGGKSVVTADHGELLGDSIRWWRRWIHPDLPHRHTERGRSFFGHARALHEPPLIDVPYHELPFETRRTVRAESPEPDAIHDGDIEEQLSALGYM